MQLVRSFVALGPLLTATSAAFTATEIFSFTPSNPVFIENLFVLPDNRILLTHFGGPGPDSPLYVLNQTSGTVSVVASLPNSTAQTGIAALGGSKYAITTGVLGANFEFVNGSVAAHIISLAPGSGTATLLDTIPIPDTISTNGLVALPAAGSNSRHILLSADSRGFRLLKINTATRTASVAFADPLFGGNPNITQSIGITGVNGLNLRPGKRWDGYVYFTNSARGIYGRVQVDSAGDKVGSGAAQVVSTIATPPGQENFFDDLAVTRFGHGYVAWQTDKLVRIDGATGAQTMVLGPGVPGAGVALRYPTSVKLGLSGREVYVATGGIDASGNMLGGQVVKVTF
ncbi:hypothetical protein QBC42DRAFT_348262 [Cladorrhinum samala]|uniref:Uncharacterized protein n=1 Tax=Cladorrhinum samala TaxID=585594 RepID=A0AAV9HHG9_9PEZI|nr:hypothetical protein QBC42DRAFT_348262 [Cladorrhinum samala]